MTGKIKELLAVLDIPEEEQETWISKYCDKEKIDNTTLIPHPELGCGDYEIEVSLADLAFRLRDEIISADLANETGWWCEASYEVFLYVIGEENERYEVGLDTWFSMYARPIHWIIAALIAKVLAKSGKTKNGSTKS